MRLIGELTTTGTLTRRGFWLRHVVVVPIVGRIAIAVSETAWAVPAALVATLVLVSIWGRRLHDRGRSAWWLVAFVVPVAGALWLCIECGFRRSAAGRTRRSDAADYLVVGAHRA